MYQGDMCGHVIKCLTSYISQTGAVQQDFYTDKDLTIGTVVNVWGRKFLLTDCDEFTKEYYKSKYGVGKSF